MVTVPAATPVATPVVDTIEATAALLLLHVPPPTFPARVDVKPAHNVVAPVIELAAGFTETITMRLQPDAIVYVIVVVPADKPDTTPVVTTTDPIDGLLLVHVPPVLAQLRVVVIPRQALIVPLITAIGFTVIVLATTHPVPAE
jgi:hypothetical protein